MRAAEVKKGNVVEYNGVVYQVRDIATDPLADESVRRMARKWLER